jgi:hypothetical protein
MTYLVVRWKAAQADEPCIMYSELDDARMQRRKLDIFPDGRWGYADEHEEVGSETILGEAATPSVDEINADPAFEAAETTREEFEKLWAVRRNARIMSTFPLDNENGKPS